MKTNTNGIFSANVLSAVKIINHVGHQIQALYEQLEKELPDRLKQKTGIIISKSKRDSDEGDLDSSGYIYIKTLHSYALEKDSKRSGKKPAFGRIYVFIQIAPETPKDFDNFTPMILIEIHRKDADKFCVEEYEDINSTKHCIDNQSDGYRELNETAIFKSANLKFEIQEEGEEEFWLVGAYYPLESINHETIETVLIRELIDGVNYCKEKWDGDSE